MTDVDLTRVTGQMALLTVVSRATGFARVITVTAVLGTTYLANTYQSANSIPNLLFELLAAGALQAGLVPTLVKLVDAGDDARTGRVAGALLGAGCVVTGVAALATAAAGRPLMWWLVRDVPDASVRAAEVRLGSFLLWVFAPQVVMYVANAVCTGVLHAKGRFTVPAAAPILNNVVVIVTYVTFAGMRGGREPSLDLTAAQRWVLAAGTTLGVAVFCGWVVVSGLRAQPRLRPNLAVGQPEVRSVARHAAWVVLTVAVTQLLTFSMLVAVNGREGGVAVFGLAWVIFLLPFSLLVVPVVTTRFPQMARAAVDGDHGVTVALRPALRATVFCSVGAAVVLVACATPIAGLVVYGEAVSARDEVARAIAAFAVGLVGYAVTLALTRASYASGNPRLPFVANAVVIGAAALAVGPLARSVASGSIVASVGLVHSTAYVVLAATLGIGVFRRVAGDTSSRVGLGSDAVAVSARIALGAGLAVAGRLAVDGIGSHGRGADAAVVLVVGGALGAAFVIGCSLFGGPPPREAIVTFGAGRDVS